MTVVLAALAVLATALLVAAALPRLLEGEERRVLGATALAAAAWSGLEAATGFLPSLATREEVPLLMCLIVTLAGTGVHVVTRGLRPALSLVRTPLTAGGLLVALAQTALFFTAGPQPAAGWPAAAATPPLPVACLVVLTITWPAAAAVSLSHLLLTRAPAMRRWSPMRITAVLLVGGFGLLGLAAAQAVALDTGLAAVLTSVLGVAPGVVGAPAVGQLLGSLGLVMIAAALLYPRLWRATRVQRDAVRAGIALRRLSCLERDLAAFEPRGRDTRQLGLEPSRCRRARSVSQLYMLVIRLRDTTWDLRAYVEDDVGAAAILYARELGQTGTDVAAITEACWLRYAMAAQRRGGPRRPALPPRFAPAPLMSATGSIPEELRLLLPVAKWWEHPAVARFPDVWSASRTSLSKA